jgi:catechol 2,3-dioxygenase
MASEDATPRRLSVRPDSELLAVDTAMGAVTLRVADLDGLTAYYRDGLLLTVLNEEPGIGGRSARVVLGRLGVPIVILEHAPELRHAAPHEAGLYHTAILFDRERDLAAAIYSVASRYPRTFTGSADHLVSKAFYFDDPEGNGVELYWDRARTEWSWVHGLPQMGAAALDPNRYLQEHLDLSTASDGTAAPAKVGHVHLSVGDTAVARAFYVDRLGFEVVAEMPGSAVFVSAGGYHHHMAMNVWNSRNAGRRRSTLGLGLVRLDVPTQDDLAELDGRLRHHGIETGHDGASLVFADPWGNALEVAAVQR